MYADTIESNCKKWLKSTLKTEKFGRIYLEEWDQIQRLCDYLRSNQPAIEQRSKFVRYIQAYDNRRNKNFTNTFPEYSTLLKDWQDA